ncbi:protein ECERIFERUM 26 [Dioscorea cayenensis subsp. rotundata]|uniref:Protein ECERIFERUM 26 n=1 Tax=Dioscorea cayennensis subsp. rotundata TaxID=55577 RepID=A0AB40B3L1_DIOCR|nr:protein ECERIFERUM 26 [Dioscorea cayenensis subsp. rotundata]XP_039121819.1 protein ECERIFERUM 26 [Dioscorea cayenensis subsp. rotundata]XP_039121820.1 protein ECERIFERUM 26 [Dioscorea cayenensis subsp. rotundata]
MANSSRKQLHIEAIQTVTPGRAAEPGQARRISLPSPTSADTLLRSHACILLYYHTSSKEETTATLAAHLKESLNHIIPEEPLLAGRLRKDGEKDGYWEIKYNDAGIRLVQAVVDTSMDEFLSGEDREAKEEMLAYWMDIQHEDSQFWPLFYVQVTEFQGDGYSIGISWSILLTDHLFMTRFLKTWARTHREMQVQGEFSEANIFHLNYFKTPTRTSTDFISGISTTPRTILYKAPRSSDLQALVHHLIENNHVSEFLLFVNDHSGDCLKVENFASGSSKTPPANCFSDKLSVAGWDELEAGDLYFVSENKPVHVSFQVISSDEHKGLVVAMLPSQQIGPNLMISVTVPVEN